MRRRTRLLLLSALVALLPWVVFRLILQGDGSDDAGGAVEREDALESPDPSLRGHGVEAQPGAETSGAVAPPRPDTIRVRVTRQEDDAPIPGAEVALCRAHTLERSHGVVVAPDVRETAATDEEGVAVLPRPPASDTAYVLRARAEGLLAGRLPWLGADDVELVLSPAKSLGGQVVDLNGRPMAGLTVTATAVGAPTEVGGHALLPWTATHAEDRTDGRGGFRFDGLEEQLYAVGVRQPGWSLRRSRSRRPVRRTPRGEENTRTVYAAGTEAARLVVERFALLSVKFWDPTTGRTLQPALSELSIAAVGGAPWVELGDIRLSPYPYFDGERWRDPILGSHDPAVYTFVVPVRGDTCLPLSIPLVYELFDRLGGTAQVELHEPLARLDGRSVNEIRVAVDPDAALVGISGVLVREVPLISELAAGLCPLLFVWPEGHDLRQLRGRRWPDRVMWVFDSLPSGRVDLPCAAMVSWARRHSST